jgi:PTH1 family peptidyl-tRNA hydrolase
LRSVTATLGAEYRRVRIGVGHPGRAEAVPGYVLQNFTKADAEWLTPLISAIAKEAAVLANGDDAAFMNRVALLTKPQRQSKESPNGI